MNHRTILLLILAGLALLLARSVVAQEPVAADSATLPADAFLDANARELLDAARARLLTIDRSIQAYSTDVTERATLSIRTPLRDRVLYGREVAAEVDWVRDGPVTVRVEGAMERLPSLTGRERVPEDLGESVSELAFEPSRTLLLGSWGNDSELVDPLRPGAERFYRYRSGPSRTIRLADGSEVRLVELQVLPRRRTPELVRGTYLFDQRTHSIVQGTFRLAGDWELAEEEEDARVVTRWIGPVRARIDYVTVNYGLWELNWWMPQLVAMRGEAEIGGLASVPLRFERRYGDYRILATPVETVQVTPEQLDSLGNRARCPARYRVAVRIGGDGSRADSVAVEDDADDGELTPAQRRECERLRVELPADSVLIRSVDLSGLPFGPDVSLMSRDEIERIEKRLQDLATLGPAFSPIRWTGPRGEAGLARYNRVEGLSLGLRAATETRIGALSLTGRIGTADRQPLGELRFAPDPILAPVQIAAYRRLVAMDSTARPSSIGNTLSALVAGRDEADYFRTLGIEAGGTESPLRRSLLRWRVYAQRETAARKRTDFSLAEVLGRENEFPENEAATAASQAGAQLGLIGAWGGQGAWRFGSEAWLEGAVGTQRYLKPSATLRMSAPLPGRLRLGVEGSGGSAFGDPAIQHLFWLGGSGSLRGYPVGYLSGDSYWRARGEVGTELPAFRLSVFSDAAWAGPRDDLSADPQALSVGAGIGLLDGLMRLDLARRLRGEDGWRLSGSLDAWF